MLTGERVCARFGESMAEKPQSIGVEELALEALDALEEAEADLARLREAVRNAPMIPKELMEGSDG